MCVLFHFTGSALFHYVGTVGRKAVRLIAQWKGLDTALWGVQPLLLHIILFGSGSKMHLNLGSQAECDICAGSLEPKCVQLKRV